MARPDPPPRLGTLEAQVTDRVWDRPGVTVRDVIEDLSGRPAYTPIATALTNPERKQLVRRSRNGRHTVYHPDTSREEHAATAMTTALGASRDHAAQILHFVQSMPEGDRALLRQYLAQDQVEHPPVEHSPEAEARQSEEGERPPEEDGES